MPAASALRAEKAIAAQFQAHVCSSQLACCRPGRLQQRGKRCDMRVPAQPVQPLPREHAIAIDEPVGHLEALVTSHADSLEAQVLQNSKAAVKDALEGRTLVVRRDDQGLLEHATSSLASSRTRLDSNAAG